MSKKLTIDIGVNGAFLTRRWEEPNNWMRLTREVGFPYHSFCADVLDPFFSGDVSYRYETAQAVREAAERYDVGIVDVYTGVATHRFHGLSHSDSRCRERMKQWIRDIYTIAGLIGAPNVGGHWDAFSVEVLDNLDKTQEAWDRIVQIMRELAVDAKKHGIEGLYSEQMYIPSEVPWTLAQIERFLIECNRDNPNGCPVRVAIDTGHMAGACYGAGGDDLKYESWLSRYGAQTAIVHVQQTTRDASHHWPFTDAYNAKGEIDIEKTIEAVITSHKEYESSEIAKYVPRVENVYFIAEIIPGSTKTETVLLDELTKSAEYLRKFIPEGGLTVEL